MELNSDQRKAVEYRGKHLLIQSGPGAGKTTTLMQRVKWLIERGVPPQCILLLTFTNHAANVMVERIEEGVIGGDMIHASTFHSFCYMIIRDFNQDKKFTIADEDDQVKVLRNILLSNPRQVDGERLTPEVAAEIINDYKCKGIWAEVSGDPTYVLYDEYLRSHDIIDFGGLQMRALEYLEEPTQWTHIMVDEYHDTSPIQFQLVRMLEQHCTSLTVVCDEHQSIYSWRGATIENILQFGEYFLGAEVVTLRRNYRSTQSIVSAITNLISYAEESIGRKELYSQRGVGPLPMVDSCWNNIEEAELVVGRIARSKLPYSEHIVLYRNNAMSRVLEEALMKAQIPYRVVAAISFYRRKEIKDVIAYLRWLHNPMDDPALRRIVNVPRRGVGKKTIEQLVAMHGSLAMAVLESDDPRDKLEPLRELRRDMEEVTKSGTILEVMDTILEKSGYLKYIKSTRDKDSVDREDNINSLLESAAQFCKQYPQKCTLADYLHVVSLVSDADTLDEDRGCVSLMSIHASKGMEAGVVHLIGAEEGILPHQRSLREDNLEEERRLAYVAISRAKNMAYITHCRNRMLYGRYMSMEPSRFIREIRRAKS